MLSINSQKCWCRMRHWQLFLLDFQEDNLLLVTVFSWFLVAVILLCIRECLTTQLLPGWIYEPDSNEPRLYFIITYYHFLWNISWSKVFLQIVTISFFEAMFISRNAGHSFIKIVCQHGSDLEGIIIMYFMAPWKHSFFIMHQPTSVCGPVLTCV